MQERGISTIKVLYSHRFFSALKLKSSLQVLVPFTWVGIVEWSSPMLQTSQWKLFSLISSGHEKEHMNLHSKEFAYGQESHLQKKPLH